MNTFKHRIRERFTKGVYHYIYHPKDSDSPGWKMNYRGDKMKKDELKLRELLWIRHGCQIDASYSDDGEMQCGNCCIDFKRDSIDKIEKTLAYMYLKRSMPVLERRLNEKRT